ncbi:tetratricopeptide repeat protein [Kitasatospora nipponensis]
MNTELVLVLIRHLKSRAAEMSPVYVGWSEGQWMSCLREVRAERDQNRGGRPSSSRPPERSAMRRANSSGSGPAVGPLHAARDVQAPPDISNLRLPEVLVGRAPELEALRIALTASSESAITQVGAVHGLGGVGKSTLARHYAYQYRGSYTLIWWINAATPAAIEGSLAELAVRLHPVWPTGATPREQAAWAHTWLHWHSGWLLIYDNVENPVDLAPYVGALNRGHHLATSRRVTGWPRTVHTLALGTLTIDDSADLLLRNIRGGGQEATAKQRQEARALAAELGCLPLALEQASAYLGQNVTVSIDEYRRRLFDQLDRTAEGARCESGGPVGGVDADRSVVRVWSQTMTALAERNPLAVNVLYTLAWLAPDDIPVTHLNRPGEDPGLLAEALGVLSAYSMVTLTPTTVSVHRLVQAVLRMTASQKHGSASNSLPNGRRDAEEAMVRALWPPDPANPRSRPWLALLPHVIALAASRPPDHHDDVAIPLYAHGAHWLHRQAQHARAIPLDEAMLEYRGRVVGYAHASTVRTRSNLATAYRAAGDLNRAIALFEVTLLQREQMLGHSHRITLRSRNNLANSYHEVGDFQRAIALHELTLTQREHVLGKIHPDTLVSRNNLACAYHDAGDLGRAIELHELTLSRREEVLGDSHPDTLNSRNNLANSYRLAGDLGRAIPLHESALAQCERVLGDVHPATLNSRNNLACAYHDAGELGRALELHELTLAQREDVLGDAHPDTLASRSNVARICHDIGDVNRSVALYELTLAQCERWLGDGHPLTRAVRSRLALDRGFRQSDGE